MLKKFFCPPCLIGLILILAVFGGYFLLKRGYQAPAPVTPEVTTPEGAPEVTPPEEAPPEVTVPEVKEFIVSGTEYSFSPSSISVRAGDQVKVTFQNTGRIAHNFVVEGLGVNTRTIGGGKTDTVEFTAPTSGTYTIFCSVPGHRAAGMEGTLEVE